MHPCLQRVSFPSWVSEDVLNQNHITRREDVLAPTLAGHQGKVVSEHGRSGWE